MRFDAQFNNLGFVFVFLPVVLIAYWLIPSRRWKLFVLALSGLVFYSFYDVRFVGLLLACAVVDFWLARAIRRFAAHRKAWLIASLTFNLGVLAIFKYLVFGVDSARSLLTLLGSSATLPHIAIVLPVGISFFTFKTMSYTIDVYRGEVEPTRDFLKYLAFIALFPDLVAGPIVRYRAMDQQFDGLPRRPSANAFRVGLTLFAIGLFKKVAIADTVAGRTDLYWAQTAALTMPEAWLAALGYTIQIYFDFSGYSDMAIGLAAMLALEFPINFRAPYQSLNPSDFWRRWHITLSTFLRDYLYIPLGGSRGSPTRTNANLLIVMLLGGLWHGAAWTFVVWGLYHGLLLILYKQVQPGWDRMPVLAQRLLTFLLVVIGWVFFRAVTLGDAAQVLQAMAGFNAWGETAGLVWPFVAIILTLAIAMRARPTAEMRLLHPNWVPVAAVLLFVSVGRMVSFNSPFLYYQF